MVLETHSTVGIFVYTRSEFLPEDYAILRDLPWQFKAVSVYGTFYGPTYDEAVAGARIQIDLSSGPPPG